MGVKEKLTCSRFLSFGLTVCMYFNMISTAAKIRNSVLKQLIILI